MIIKSINIISFGKLKNKTVNFSDNFNVIYGRNESGKTTISSFIEAMLYSFPPRSDRGKYLPWDNSPAAGEMTVNVNGRDLTFYRKFAPTPKGDIIEPADFSLEGIIPPTRDSYRKTVYSQEGKCGDFGSTSEIEARITNIMTTGRENTGASDAIKYLEKFRRKINSGNKLKSLENKITILEDEYSRAFEEAKSLSDIKAKITEKRRILENYELQIKDTEKKKSNDLPLRLKALDEEIDAQKTYIGQFPDLEKTLPQKSSPGKTSLVLTILCTLMLVIAGFFTHYAIALSALLPPMIYLIIYKIKIGKFHRETNSFLTRAGCTSLSEYEKMCRDKESAVEYYNKLLKEKSKILSLRAEELKSDNSNIIYRKILALKKEIEELESHSKPTSREPEIITQELVYYKNLHKELAQKLKAVGCAIDAFNYAKDVISTDFTPQVTKTAMEYLNLVAPKEGRSVSLGSDMSITVSDPLHQSLSSQSFGFREEVYLCFRIAWSEFLYGKDFPLILDDPFTGSDDYREKALINLLCSLSEHRQIIIFTNRKNSCYSQLNCNWVDITPSNDV